MNITHFLDKVEKYIQKIILPDLDRGRASDKQHTLAVVKYLKEILIASNNPNDDWYVLVISAYAHDWGYTDLFEDNSKLTLKEIGKQKERHMIIGSEKIGKVLSEKFFNFMSNEQKDRCVHLVSVHDKLEALNDRDELLLMEADTLGGLDPKIMGIFNTKESEDRFLQKNKDLRYTKFISGYAKKRYKVLFKERVKFAEINSKY